MNIEISKIFLEHCVENGILVSINIITTYPHTYQLIYILMQIQNEMDLKTNFIKTNVMNYYKTKTVRIRKNFYKICVMKIKIKL